MVEMVIGCLVFAFGYFTCYFTMVYNKKDESKVETVKQVIKPNLRNPLQTYDTSYERYKSKDNNLYEPVKPKLKTRLGERDNGA